MLKSRPVKSRPVAIATANKFFFIDCLKAISIVAVTSFHSLFITFDSNEIPFTQVEILFSPLRFCVPIFFTVSFFLYETSELRHPSNSFKTFIRKRYPRLLYPTLFWFAIASMLSFLKGNSLAEISTTIAQGEIFTGAYYLLALIQLLPIFYWWRKNITTKANLIIALIIQAALTIMVYLTFKNIALSNFIYPLRLVNRPLFLYWFIYLALGIYLARNFPRIKAISSITPKQIKLSLGLFLTVFFWHDYQILHRLTDSAIAPFEYLTLSAVWSVPIIFFCCSAITEKGLPRWLLQTVKLLSKYSLGIYCINGTLRLVFLSIGSSLHLDYSFQVYEILTLKLIGWSILLLISLLLSILLDRLGLTKAVC